MPKQRISQKGLLSQAVVWPFLFWLFFTAQAPALEVDLHGDWDTLLKKHVQNGLVDYTGLKKDRAVLDQYFKKLEALSADSLGDASREERIAFWLNLYNASVIRMVLDEYPIRRFDQISAAFDIRTIRVVGEFFSLSELRDKILRQYFRDERIVTALVSARMDSPRLLNEAFRGDRLEAQLNRSAAAFVEDEDRNKIIPGEKKVFLSPVFHEFENDFILNFNPSRQDSKFSDSESAVISFILEHLQNPDKRLFLNSGRYKIDFLPENAELNDVHH